MTQTSPPAPSKPSSWFSAVSTYLAHTAVPSSSRPRGASQPTVVSVSLSATHVFSKQSVPEIKLVVDRGVEGDCHFGETVQHLSRMKVPVPPKNLRQVHLIHSELFAEVADLASVRDANAVAYTVAQGQLGENVTTVGIDLLALGQGTRLRFVDGDGDGDEAEAEVDGRGEGEGEAEGLEVPTIVVTGLRNPCPQIDKFRPGLKERCLLRNEDGSIRVRKAGIMAVVEVGGVIRPGMRILVDEPAVWKALECV